MAVNSEEKRAASFVLMLLLVGIAVRVLAPDQNAPGDVVFRPVAGETRADPDSLAVQSGRLATPLRRGEKIDVDRADQAELTRLPRIGPALAARMTEDRENRGPFGSLEALQRVSGIGPGLLNLLEPHVEFSGTARSLPWSADRPVPISLSSASAEQLAELPGIGPTKAAAIVEYRRRFGRFSSVDDLLHVAGIGPATVARVRGLVRVP